MNWSEIERVYLEASALPASQCKEFLDQACAADAVLRREVEGMLQADGEHADFLDAPPAHLAAHLLKTAGKPAASIGNYRIIRVLGEGGMGIVYEAEQKTPRRTVALKVIKTGAGGKEILRRFRQEAEALGRLQHPGIAQIYDAGTAGQGSALQPYFVMELIEGRPILRYAEEEKLDADSKLALMAKVCDAVHHAHQRGILHRDLKPGNILVDRAGQPKILDFGVARVMDSDIQATRQTDVGQLIGTLAYMSPEQADFQITDKRSDLFSVGVVLAHLLLGRNIFKGATAEESRNRIMHQPIPDFRALDPRIDDRLNDILHHALAHDLDRRYATGEQLMHDLEVYIYGAGYGPTNETLGKYIRELFGQEAPKSLPEEPEFKTIVLEETARIRSRKH